MSLLLVNSCGDTYDTVHLSQRWSVVAGSPTVVPGTGRRLGTNGINLPGTSSRLDQNLTAAATYGVGVAVKADALVATDLLTFREGTTDHVIIRLTTTGAIEVLRAPSTQLGITAAGVVFAGVYFYLEALATIHDSTGAVTVQLNGTPVLTLTSQDTNNAGAVGTIDNIQLEGSAANIYIDDFYIIDTAGASPQNTLLGDTRVDSAIPNADGTTNNWTTVFPASPVTHFDKVDEVPPDGDGTYLSDFTGGALELFGISTLPDADGVSPIFGVQLALVARKNKSAARSIRAKLRSGSTNYNGSAFALDIPYAHYLSIFQQDPDTAADWVEADLNAIEIGAELI